VSVSVFVVDDTEHVRKMLADMLSLDGFDVVGEASGGEQAVELVQQADPQVVIMDLRMPDMDGLEATRRIRAVRPGQAVILYTAYVDAGLERQAREAGVALCLGKVEGIGKLERELSRLAMEIAES
jgi:CheY-like chemotaxis protein